VTESFGVADGSSGPDGGGAGIGFSPEEIRTDQSTRQARLKWVVVVDEALASGRAVNAAICVASTTSVAVTGLLGPEAFDASGTAHPGLPWAGCSILAASGQRLTEIHAAAAELDEVFVAGMPAQAQSTRVYDEYREQLADLKPEELRFCAVSLVGPRKRIDKLVHRLPLLP
jgi:hypothetical protein